MVPKASSLPGGGVQLRTMGSSCSGPDLNSLGAVGVSLGRSHCCSCVFLFLFCFLFSRKKKKRTQATWSQGQKEATLPLRNRGTGTGTGSEQEERRAPAPVCPGPSVWVTGSGGSWPWWQPCRGHTRLYSFRFSCKMVSFTAANTKRMFSVSVAQVKWE